MQLDTQFWTALLQIIGINIVLSGDNAVVIAMACRSLPPNRQKWGIFLGASAAIVLRVVFTVFIVYLLTVPYLKIVGGLLLFWIGYQLLTDTDDEDDVKAATSLWHAVRIVLVADAVMSLDNVIAVAAAANGNYTLLILGLAISVPLVIYGATLLIRLIDRFPAIIPAGAALIGYVAGEVIVTDPMVRDWIDGHAAWLQAAAPLIGAIVVMLFGQIMAPTPKKPKPARTTGRLLAIKSPLAMAFVASVAGYAIAHIMRVTSPVLETALEALLAARPVFAAIIAVVIGDIAASTIRRWRHGRPLDNAR